MKPGSILLTVLYYTSRVIATLYLATGLHALTSIVFRTASFAESDGGQKFVVNYPFTNRRFLLGDDYSFWYIFEMLAFFFSYALLFWLLGNIFRMFQRPKLFTQQHVNNLRIFYLFNMLTPLPFLAGHIITGYEVLTMISLTILHVVLGIFAYLLAFIFSRGLSLQREQDLII
jgi:hypothetical protein